MTGVRDGGFAQQWRILRQQRIDGRIHTRNKERGDAGDAFERLAKGLAPFEPSDVRLGGLLIGGGAEEKGDVDVRAARDQFLNGAASFRCARHLDHHVRPIDEGEQAPGLGHGFCGVGFDPRRYFERDVAVFGSGAVVNCTKDVGDGANVFDRQ